jgi:hypothetical protein
VISRSDAEPIVRYDLNRRTNTKLPELTGAAGTTFALYSGPEFVDIHKLTLRGDLKQSLIFFLVHSEVLGGGEGRREEEAT